MTVATTHKVYSSSYTFTSGASIRCECGWTGAESSLNKAIDAYVAHLN